MSAPQETTPKKPKRNVMLALGAKGLGGPPVQDSPTGGGPAKPPAPETPPQEETEEEREQRESRERAEREAQEQATRDREERERLDREKLQRQPQPPQPAPEVAEERRGRGRPKTAEPRRGRSFRATDDEYNVVYTALDKLFTMLPPSQARRIEPSAIIRACLRIGAEQPARVLDEIEQHNDFTP